LTNIVITTSPTGNTGEETVVDNDVEHWSSQYPESRGATRIWAISSSVTPPDCRLTAAAAPGNRKSLILASATGIPEWQVSHYSCIIRAAPTGVAGNQINGQMLHSLRRLPIDGNYRPLTETPTVLSNLQRVFNGVKYLVIDEKSMLGLKTLGLIDQRLREIFPRSGDKFFGGLSVSLIGDFFQAALRGMRELFQVFLQGLRVTWMGWLSITPCYSACNE
jgi:hypothetical protein